MPLLETKKPAPCSATLRDLDSVLKRHESKWLINRNSSRTGDLTISLVPSADILVTPMVLSLEGEGVISGCSNNLGTLAHLGSFVMC